MVDAPTPPSTPPRRALRRVAGAARTHVGRTRDVPTLALLALVGLVPGAARADQLLVPTFQVVDVEPSVGEVATELVLEALSTRHGLAALGPKDVRDLLSVEAQQQLVGCTEGRCVKDAAQALGATRLVTGVVAKLGSERVLTLKLVDAGKQEVLARASKPFGALEALRTIVGPTVDALLGAEPRAARPLPALTAERKAREAQRTALDVETWTAKLVEPYADAIAAGVTGPALLTRRRALLEELLLTPFLTELEAKRERLRARVDALRPQLAARALAARDADGYLGARVAERELVELDANLSTLLEVVQGGLEREKLGTGLRPVELPFATRVAVARLTPLAPEQASRFEAARRTLDAALAHVRDGDRKAFVAACARDDRRVDPRDLYLTLLALSERGPIDVAPWFGWSADERVARLGTRPRLAVRGLAEGGTTTLVDVELDGSRILPPLPPKR
jgi:hypothetical protein